MKTKDKTKWFQKGTAILLAAAMTVGILPVDSLVLHTKAASTLSKPQIERDSSMDAKQKVTWDCVWFGSYPQSEVERGEEEYTTLQNATGWSNNEVTIDGVKYRRMKKGNATYSMDEEDEYYQWTDATSWHYFRYEKIKWRVLNVANGKALLLSDKVLDDQIYHTPGTEATWENCTIRTWLNDAAFSKSFLNCAFSSEEQNAISKTTLTNTNNSQYDTEGGNNTEDYIFLLSESDVYSGSSAATYGFIRNGETCDEARRTQGSAYAKAMGLYTECAETGYAGNCIWWLRTPGVLSTFAGTADYDGYVDMDGVDVDSANIGVRPALWINTAAQNCWRDAGTVCSNGMVKESLDYWSFSNSHDYFGNSDEGYYITEEDYARLLSNLTPVERAAISKSGEKAQYNIDGVLTGSDKIETWEGSCFGMSTWVVLNQQNIVQAKDIDARRKYLSDFMIRKEENSKIESAINYYFGQQHLPLVLDAIAEFKNLAQIEQLQVLEKSVKEKACVILFYYTKNTTDENGNPVWEAGGHAVVGYGVEEKESGWEEITGSTEYTKRILIYDCSNPEEETKELGDIYYTDTGKWCIPGYEIYSTSHNAVEDMYNNGSLDLVTNDVNILNAVDYRSGSRSIKMTMDNPQNVYVYVNDDTDFSVGWENASYTIKNGMATGSGSNKTICVIPTMGTTSEGISASTATAILPISPSGYTINTIQDKLDFSIQSGNYYETAIASLPGTVYFGAAGEVTMKTSASADYYISLTANDGYHTLPWHTVDITGSGASQVSAKMTESGIEVSGNNLNNLSINAESNVGTKTIMVSSAEPKILIASNSGALAVYEDKNNDGKFETLISQPQETTAVSKTKTDNITIKKGSVYTVSSLKYKVTKTAVNGKGGTVAVVAPKNKKLKKVTIPKAVKIKGVSYTVTSIAAKAFKGCSKLKKITIKTTKLKKVGAKAFKGIHKKAIIKVPKAKLKAYTKLLKKKGQAKTVRIKK